MNSEINLDNYDKPLDFNINRLAASLQGLSPVISIRHRLSERFTLGFRENFSELPLSTTRPRNRSNWTQHTSFAIMAAAKSLFLCCTFEVMGRLDAVIETTSENPDVILLAEWESNPHSVFGVNNELEKLWVGTNQHKVADAFLFTYCAHDNLMDFVKKVVEFWQGNKTTRAIGPTLFLTAVVYQRTQATEKFIFLRTLEIDSEKVSLWHDISFVDLSDYVACIRGI